MDSKYENLREKNIFDFTDDPEILDEMTFSKTREEFEKGVIMIGRALSFLELADLINDRALESAVLKEFKYELTPNM